MIRLLERRLRICQPGYGEKRIPACTQNASTGMATPNWCWNCQSLEHQTDQCSLKLSATKHARRDGLRPKDLCKKYKNNDGICAVMGPSASLHTSVSLVVDRILIPDALEREKSNQEITRASSHRTYSCIVHTTIDKFTEIQLASYIIMYTSGNTFNQII